jgi:hypothetical protein
MTAGEDQWEDFQGKRQLFDQRHPIVSIQSKGNFGLNRQSFEALGRPERVILRYNKATGAIGIRPAYAGEPYSYTVKKQAQADSYVVTGKAFLQYIGYETGKLRTFQPKVEGGMLVLELES